MESKKFDLYLRGFKGLSVLKALCEKSVSSIGTVYVDTEENVAHDYFKDICDLVASNNLSTADFRKKDSQIKDSRYSVAVGWRFMIERENLLVLHDSLLPKYRGFNPLVSMLLSGEKEIGATLLFAEKEVDTGNIIIQKKAAISYPIKLSDAMNVIGVIYADIIIELAKTLKTDQEPKGYAQAHELATFSLWRDDEDYRINWNQPAESIKQFIDSVGYPYSGAISIINNRKVRILDARVLPDLNFENRTAGKVYKLTEGKPEVVCGSGLLLLEIIFDDETKESVLPFKKLKQRFT